MNELMKGEVYMVDLADFELNDVALKNEYRKSTYYWDSVVIMNCRNWFRQFLFVCCNIV